MNPWLYVMVAALGLTGAIVVGVDRKKAGSNGGSNKSQPKDTQPNNTQPNNTQTYPPGERPSTPAEEAFFQNAWQTLKKEGVVE